MAERWATRPLCMTCLSVTDGLYRKGRKVDRAKGKFQVQYPVKAVNGYRWCPECGPVSHFMFYEDLARIVAIEKRKLDAWLNKARQKRATRPVPRKPRPGALPSQPKPQEGAGEGLAGFGSGEAGEPDFALLEPAFDASKDI